MLSSQVTLNKYPVVAPNLITIDGVHQNPHAIAKISKRRQFIYDLYHINYYLSLLISFTAKVTRKFTQRRDHEEHKEGQIIHQGYGACYILTPVFFQHFDALKSPSFLMHEELFLSIQLEKSGLNMYYEPAISIIHYDHATVSKVATKKFWKISADAYWEFKKILNQNLIALK
jgi:GT2 family glycosyltransferase